MAASESEISVVSKICQRIIVRAAACLLV